MVRLTAKRAGLALIAGAAAVVACVTSEAPRPGEKRVVPGVVDTATSAADGTNVASAVALGKEPGTARGTSACEKLPPPPASEVTSPIGGPRDVAAGEQAMKEGLAAAGRGDWAAAQTAYERAIAADPYAGLAYLEAAESHLYTDDDRPKIRGLLASAIHLLPENPRVQHRYADVLAELGETARAEAHWRCALELRPDLVEARKRLATQLQADGKLAEAEAELRRALKDAPEDLQARLLLAEVLEAEKKLGDAAKELEIAAKAAKKGAPLYRRAASLYETAGNLVAAKRCNAAADKLDPPAKDRNLRPLPKARDDH